VSLRTGEFPRGTERTNVGVCGGPTANGKAMVASEAGYGLLGERTPLLLAGMQFRRGSAPAQFRALWVRRLLVSLGHRESRGRR